jgi:hypothetical protein
MLFKSLYIAETFEAGLAVGSLRSFLASNCAGELRVVKRNGSIEVELMVHNPLVMSYCEEKLAAFV